MKVPISLTIKNYIYRISATLLCCFTLLAGIDVYAQEVVTGVLYQDSLLQNRDTINSNLVDSIAIINEQNLEALEIPVDTAQLVIVNDTLKTKKLFTPDSNRAIWMATIFPGGGQIYNRKYWKLPIIYGGFFGCSYALTWNNKMYKDYSQAYVDIMDNDPTTTSYLDISSHIAGREDQYKEILRKRKDMFRRNRDLSIFCFIGVYLISIIDAYVDAELSDFDISPDLGLKIEPTIINDKRTGNSFGLQCSIKF